MKLVNLISTVPSTNFTRGRSVKISQVSEHHVVGDARHAVEKAQIQGREFSCTFTIGMDGTVYQLVDEANTPYTDNDFASNSRSITIEHAGGGDFPYTEKMYQASIELHRYLFNKYGLIKCIRHRDIPEIKADPSKATECPGQLDVERIVREAKEEEVWTTGRGLAIRELRVLLHKSPTEKQIKEWTGLTEEELGKKLDDVRNSEWFKEHTAKINALPQAKVLPPGVYEFKG